jgi:hypothetical protein
MSAAKKGNKARLGLPRSVGAGSPSQQIEVIDLHTGIQTVYTSMGEAARALDVPTGSVRSYFSRNTQKPFKGQYKLSKI